MIRTIKLGAAVAAVLALSAFGAAAAQAGSLDVGASPAILTSSQVMNNRLKITSPSGSLLATVECETVSLEATTSSASVTEFTTVPHFGAFGTCALSGQAATVSPGSCSDTLSGVGAAALTFNMSVAGCTSTLTVTQGTCTLVVTSTSITLEKITFASVAGSPKHVTATFAITKLPVSGGTGCPASLQTIGMVGDMTGTQTMKAFSDSGGVEGTQVSLEAT